MIGEMLFWLEEVGVDGFCCDVVGEVFDDFWVQVVLWLRVVNFGLFMLVEFDYLFYWNEEWFVMNYGWEFYYLMNVIVKGEWFLLVIDMVLVKKVEVYNWGYFMNFLMNYDENLW